MFPGQSTNEIPRWDLHSLMMRDGDWNAWNIHIGSRVEMTTFIRRPRCHFDFICRRYRTAGYDLLIDEENRKGTHATTRLQYLKGGTRTRRSRLIWPRVKKKVWFPLHRGFAPSPLPAEACNNLWEPAQLSIPPAAKCRAKFFTLHEFENNSFWQKRRVRRLFNSRANEPTYYFT